MKEHRRCPARSTVPIRFPLGHNNGQRLRASNLSHFEHQKPAHTKSELSTPLSSPSCPRVTSIGRDRQRPTLLTHHKCVRYNKFVQAPRMMRSRYRGLNRQHLSSCLIPSMTVARRVQEPYVLTTTTSGHLLTFDPLAPCLQNIEIQTVHDEGILDGQPDGLRARPGDASNLECIRLYLRRPQLNRFSLENLCFASRNSAIFIAPVHCWSWGTVVYPSAADGLYAR